MKAIVTGGAGFIGSHLSRQLAADGHQVVIIDNLACGQLENIKTLLTDKEVSFHQADIRQPEVLTELFDGADWVFHLAGLADIVPSIEMPEDYYQVNVSGTFNVLRAAQKAGVSRFIYAASSSCYGMPEEFPTDEHAPIRPQYPYALTKNLGEQLVLHWGQVYKLPVVSLRLFNVYGPNSRTNGAYGAVFGVFLAQKINGQPFTVVGDGCQTRDFTFVTDVVKAFICAAESDLTGEVFNVGSGGTYSINRLVELLGGDVVYLPKRPGEPDCTFADINKITTQLGWHPRVDFDQGVATMLEHIDSWKHAPVWTEDSISEATQSWFKYLSA